MTKAAAVTAAKSHARGLDSPDARLDLLRDSDFVRLLREARLSDDDIAAVCAEERAIAKELRRYDG